jgi:competence protein ComEC
MNTPIKQTSIWEQIPVLRLLISFVMGILIYDQATIGQCTNGTIVSTAICVAGIVIITYSLSTKRLKLLSSIASIILPASLACTICYVKDESRSAFTIVKENQFKKSSMAVVIAKPELKTKTIKYALRIINTIQDGKANPEYTKASLYVFKTENPPNVNKGDTLLLPNQWQFIRNGGNPFEIDYQKICARKNIYIQQFLYPDQIVVYAQRNTADYSVLDEAHQYCINSINHHIKDSTTNALLKAMIIGDEQDIDPNTRDAYSDTGIIHIISISGAHVAILFVAIGFLLGFIKAKKHEWLKILLGLVLIWFYVILAGASTPALRAALMFSILALGKLTGQGNNPLNQLFSTAFLLLVFQPMWLFAIGFQLSFTAVLSLIVFYPSLAAIFKPKNKIAEFFNNTIAASIAAEILVAPLVAYYFHNFPIMFIIANVIASVAMGVVLLLGMLLIIFARTGFIANVISTIIVSISEVFHRCIYFLQPINFRLFKTINLPLSTILLLYFFIGSIAIAILLKRKQAIWASAFALLLMSFIHLQKSLQILEREELIVFNQNKATQCELIRANTYSILSGGDKEDWITRNAHIGLHNPDKEEQNKKRVLLIRNKKILLLDSTTKTKNPFPVDIIIVKSWKKHINVNDLAIAFSPEQIVIANNQNQYQTKEWIEQCGIANIKLHNTRTDGAFIIPTAFK